jgi:hypothetical protein
MKAIIFSVALIFCFSVYARIGETPKECMERYGKPSLDNGEFKFYKAFGYFITVTFISESKGGIIEYGKSIFIAFSKTDGDMTNDEIKEILDANSEGEKWDGDKESMRRKTASAVVSKKIVTILRKQSL